MSEQWNDKVLNAEVTPPPGVWDNIALELKESNEFLPLSHRLYDFDVEPPDSVWNDIVSSLDSNVSYHVAPVKHLRVRIYKVMAAAFFGVVVLGSIYILNNGLKKKQTSGTQSILSANKKQRPPGSPKNNPVENSPQSRPLVPHLSVASSFLGSNKGKKVTPPESNKVLQNAIIKNVSSMGSGLGIMIAARPIRNEKGYIIQSPELLRANGANYINITGPNGQQTRISAKFLHALMYINSDTDIEKFEGFFDKPFLESLVWKTRFEQWRKKIITSSFIPSSTNFFDILELKDLILKEEQNR